MWEPSAKSGVGARNTGASRLGGRFGSGANEFLEVRPVADRVERLATAEPDVKILETRIASLAERLDGERGIAVGVGLSRGGGQPGQIATGAEQLVGVPGRHLAMLEGEGQCRFELTGHALDLSEAGKVIAQPGATDARIRLALAKEPPLFDGPPQRLPGFLNLAGVGKVQAQVVQRLRQSIAILQVCRIVGNEFVEDVAAALIEGNRFRAAMETLRGDTDLDPASCQVLALARHLGIAGDSFS